MKKKILILAANPQNTQSLRLDEEMREIDAGLRRSKRRDDFEIKITTAIRYHDLRRAMLDEKPEFVHFCGHGHGDKGIALEDESGQAKLVSTEVLAEFFKLFSSNLECVVLNACYSDVQAKAISQNIPYVIGMTSAIEDKIAIEFSRAYYDGIGAGESIDFAYKLACNAIKYAGLPDNLMPIIKKPKKTKTRVNKEQQLEHTTNSAKVAFSPKVSRKPAPQPPKRLIDEIAAQRVIPVIGAGLSLSVINKKDDLSVMPDYIRLLQKLVDRAEEIIPAERSERKIRNIRGAIEERATAEAARDLQELLGFSFFQELRNILNPLDDTFEPSPAHNLLKTLDFHQIITTNYDRLLEKFVAPRHEIITPFDTGAFEFFDASFSKNPNDKFILKLHGDITRPETIAFGEENLERLYSDKYSDERSMKVRRFLYRLFNGKIFLFLGFSFERSSEGYVKFLKHYLNQNPYPNYALVPLADDKDKSWRMELSNEANIQFLEYEPDKQHSQVWEFISFLNVAKKDHPVAGQKWAQWYLPKQRYEYLLQQLELEKSARAIKFINPTLTNALTTDEFLEQKVFPKYKDAPEVIRAMKARKQNLEDRLFRGELEVRALFLKESLDNDFTKPDLVIVNRYKYVVQLYKDTRNDIEVRIVSEVNAEFFKQYEATYAIIFSGLPRPFVDVAIAYASQATTDFFEIHMVEINTESTKEKSFQFEKVWSAAWGEQQTINYIEELISKATQDLGK